MAFLGSVGSENVQAVLNRCRGIWRVIIHKSFTVLTKTVIMILARCLSMLLHHILSIVGLFFSWPWQFIRLMRLVLSLMTGIVTAVVTFQKRGFFSFGLFCCISVIICYWFCSAMQNTVQNSMQSRVEANLFSSIV